MAMSTPLSSWRKVIASGDVADVLSGANAFREKKNAGILLPPPPPLELSTAAKDDNDVVNDGAGGGGGGEVRKMGYATIVAPSPPPRRCR